MAVEPFDLTLPDGCTGPQAIDFRCIQLATAILRRAFQDLTITVEPGYNIHELRYDAYDFLMNRLWEPDNLWGELISTFLERKTLVDAVSRKCSLGKDGRVYLTKEQ